MGNNIEFITIDEQYNIKPFILVMKNGNPFGQILKKGFRNENVFFKFVNLDELDISSLNGISNTISPWRNGRDEYDIELNYKIKEFYFINGNKATKNDVKNIIKSYYFDTKKIAK